MQDKKVLILIVLTIFAVISIFYGIMAPAKRKIEKSAATVTGERFIPAQGSVSTARRAKRSQFKSWTRSPFAPSGAAASGLTLSGIIWNKDKPKAMIGSVIVGKGEKIADNTVVDIKHDRVILNDGTKNIELKLEK